MKKRALRARDLPLRVKLTAIFLALVILPFIIGSLLLFQNANQVMIERAFDSRQDLLDALREDIDARLQSIRDSVVDIYRCTPLFNAGESYMARRLSLNNYFQLNERFNALMFMDTQDASIKLSRGLDSEREQAFFKADNAQWLDKITQANGKPVWMTFVSPEHGASLLCGMMIKNVYSLHETVGYAIFLLDGSALNEFLELLCINEDSDAAIVLPDGDVLYIGRQTWSDGFTLDTGLFPDKAGYYIAGSAAGLRILTVYAKSSDSGWTYVSRTPLSQIQMLNKPFAVFFWFFFAILLAFLWLYGRLIDWTVTRPLRRVVVSLSLSADGKVRPIDYDAQDEIGTLVRTYNEQFACIRSLMEINESSRRRELQQELNALQAQINPHFLYNSLDSIAWMARAQGAPEVARHLAYLARSLRYAISPDNPYATFGQELDWVREYVALQQLRTPQLFTCRIDAPEALMNYGTFRLVLQPFVENSIRHGFRARQTGGEICIRAACEGGDVIIFVEDNGSGFPAGELDRFQSKLTDGIGLYNVHRRLRLRFGERYGVSAENLAGGGSRVTLRLPLIPLDVLAAPPEGSAAG